MKVEKKSVGERNIICGEFSEIAKLKLNKKFDVYFPEV